jgi:hypothetical protein
MKTLFIALFLSLAVPAQAACVNMTKIRLTVCTKENATRIAQNFCCCPQSFGPGQCCGPCVGGSGPPVGCVCRFD